MKIAIFSPDPDEKNGIADYARALTCSLEGVGAQVIHPYKDVHFQHSLEYFREREIDHIHVEIGGNRLREFHTLEWLAQHKGDLTFTLTVHDPDRVVWRLPYFSRDKSSLLGNIESLITSKITESREQKILSAASGIVTLTRSGRDALSKRFPKSADKIVHIPHPCWTAEKKIIPSKAECRLLCFGFFYRGKGFEQLIETLADIKKQYSDTFPPIKMTFAGGSKPDVGHKNTYIDELKNMAQASGIAEQLRFVTNLDEAEIAPLIQEHQLVILPYQQSAKLNLLGHLCGASGVLARVLGAGRGVIASSARSLSEELENPIGILYPAGQRDGLNSAIMQAIERQELWCDWADNAYQLGQERSWDNSAQHFLDFFTAIHGKYTENKKILHDESISA